MTTIYLIRHATPDWTRSDLSYFRLPGPPLTEQGRAEAQRLGEFFQAAGVRSVYASPMERCARTAQIAARVVGLQTTIAAALIEWQENEDMPAVQARMSAAFEQALAESVAAGPVALVTHGGPIVAQLMTLGMSETMIEALRVYDHRNVVPPAGAWRARRAEPMTPWALELVFDPATVSPD